MCTTKQPTHGDQSSQGQFRGQHCACICGILPRGASCDNEWLLICRTIPMFLVVMFLHELLCRPVWRSPSWPAGLRNSLSSLATWSSPPFAAGTRQHLLQSAFMFVPRTLQHTTEFMSMDAHVPNGLHRGAECIIPQVSAYVPPELFR